VRARRGLRGTIGAVLVRLIDRGFVPHAKPVRDALGVPPEARDSMFYELYDPTPIVDIADPALMGPLRIRMQVALARALGVPRGARRLLEQSGGGQTAPARWFCDANCPAVLEIFRSRTE